MIQIIEGITTAQLAELYTDPYIKRIGHDHGPAYPVFHPSASYICAFVNGEFAGAFLVIQDTEIDLQAHALLKKRFVRESRTIGKTVLSYLFAKPIQRITTYIIEGMETAVNYCLKLGFKIEGFKRNATMVNGHLKGDYILGITRMDWSKSNG